MKIEHYVEWYVRAWLYIWLKSMFSSISIQELWTAKSIDRSGKNSKIDDSIRHGFDWLIKTVYENYGSLNKRVEEDVRQRKEAEEIAKRERKERVQKMREE